MTRPTNFEEIMKETRVLALIPYDNYILLKDLKEKCKEYHIGNRSLPKILDKLQRSRTIVKGTEVLRGRALICYKRIDQHKTRSMVMAVPKQLVNGVQSYADLTYHIQGELVPVLHIQLGSMPVYFEQHVLLWKDPAVQIEVKPLKGAFKRIIAGMPVFLTRTKGAGQIAFSRDGVGHVVAMHLKSGESLDVRENQFLAATDDIDFSYTRMRGAANILFGGTGFFIDNFTCQQQGVLWLHGYGNVFEMTLQKGEQVDIDGGGWIYKDSTVQMETIHKSLADTGQLFWNRFTGPGRVGLQSMYIHTPTGPDQLPQ